MSEFKVSGETGQTFAEELLKDNKNKKTSYSKLILGIIVVATCFAAVLLGGENDEFLGGISALDYISDVSVPPSATIGETVNIDGIEMKVSGISCQNGKVTITAEGRNTSEKERRFSSSDFELGFHDSDNPENYGYAALQSTWKYTVRPESEFSFSQTFIAPRTEDCLYTLTYFKAERKISAQFLLISDENVK